MKHLNKNLLLLFNVESLPGNKLEIQVSTINRLLASVDTPEQFCTANELVNRNSITSNKKKMLKEASHFRLRPFRFFINKN